jgi:UDP-glucose 4-epimerase
MILLTGATGYIGSHLWVELLKSNYPVIGIDNLSNSNRQNLEAIKEASSSSPIFMEGDVRNPEFLDHVFTKYPIDLVIHLAALKDIQDSMLHKKEYEDCNIGGMKTLLHTMNQHRCKKLVFSSSAAVYGDQAVSPISETSTPAPSNIYGETKLECERLIGLESSIKSIVLRFFNVSGSFLPIAKMNSHSLFDAIKKVSSRTIDKLNIFGGDWPTKDGTCIRDYLHISDLLDGHILAIPLLNKNQKSWVLNLGLGQGFSVLDVINTVEEITEVKIPKTITSRRPGDIATSFANVDLAKQLIKWNPKKSLKNICQSL